MSEQKLRLGDRVTVKGRPWLTETRGTFLMEHEGIIVVKLDNPKGGIRYFPFLYLKPAEVERDSEQE